MLFGIVYRVIMYMCIQPTVSTRNSGRELRTSFSHRQGVHVQLSINVSVYDSRWPIKVDQKMMEACGSTVLN